MSGLHLSSATAASCMCCATKIRWRRWWLSTTRQASLVLKTWGASSAQRFTTSAASKATTQCAASCSTEESTFLGAGQQLQRSCRDLTLLPVFAPCCACVLVFTYFRPLLACDILSTAIAAFPQATKLHQLYGLALAQAGSTFKAMNVLEELRSHGDTSEETGGVLARCYKDLAATADSHDRRQGFYLKAYEVYKAAYEGCNKTSFYTGINTATMAMLLGRTTEANALAAEVRVLLAVTSCRTLANRALSCDQVAELCEAERVKLQAQKAKAQSKLVVAQKAATKEADKVASCQHSQRKGDVARRAALVAKVDQLRAEVKSVDQQFYWLSATLGEVSVIQGRLQEAMAFFQEATLRCVIVLVSQPVCVTHRHACSAPKAYGKYASTLRQLKLLLDHRQQAQTHTYSRRASAVQRMTEGLDQYVDQVVTEARHYLRLHGMQARQKKTRRSTHEDLQSGANPSRPVHATLTGTIAEPNRGRAGQPPKLSSPFVANTPSDGGFVATGMAGSSGHSSGWSTTSMPLSSGDVTPGNAARVHQHDRGLPARANLDSTSKSAALVRYLTSSQDGWLRPRARLACERVIEALASKRPLDDAFVQCTSLRACGKWIDVDS